MKGHTPKQTISEGKLGFSSAEEAGGTAPILVRRGVTFAHVIFVIFIHSPPPILHATFRPGEAPAVVQKESDVKPLLPAALRAAQICRYLVYSETDFEVFRPAGATRCTDGGEIWRGPLLHAKFHPIGATTRV